MLTETSPGVVRPVFQPEGRIYSRVKREASTGCQKHRVVCGLCRLDQGALPQRPWEDRADGSPAGGPPRLSQGPLSLQKVLELEASGAAPRGGGGGPAPREPLVSLFSTSVSVLNWRLFPLCLWFIFLFLFGSKQSLSVTSLPPRGPWPSGQRAQWDPRPTASLLRAAATQPWPPCEYGDRGTGASGGDLEP